MADSRTTPHYLLLGEVLRPHGVRGEIRLKILTDYPERVGELETVYIGDDVDDAYAKAYTVEKTRFHKQFLLLKLAEISQREAVDPLRGKYVMVDMANAIPLEEGEFYLFELIGLTVQNDTGDTLGTIKDVLETGANDVYIVNSPRYGELLIPAHSETLLSVDLDAGVVTVKLPDGLLDQ